MIVVKAGNGDVNVQMRPWERLYLERILRLAELSLRGKDSRDFASRLLGVIYGVDKHPAGWFYKDGDHKS